MKRVLNRGLRMTLCGLVSSVLVLGPAEMNAAEFFYFFNDAGATPASSPSQSPVSVLFADVEPGVVNLTITGQMLEGGEYLRRLNLNIAPNLNPSDLQFTVLEASDDFKEPRIFQRADRKGARDGGKYDIGFRFSGSKPTRFEAGDYVVFQISGISGLTAEDFTALSFPGSGDDTYFAAAKFRPGNSGELKGWQFSSLGAVPVPEPSSSLLLLLGAGLTFVARRGGKTK
jgi:hypothetical protein